ncbi:hypothetical protein SETIT_4G135600v2 [Setaria italica]|uniref:DUF1618 domain-containing protein n=1 Tax=Setaria italica TaxID=4555 RepID=A0A368QTU6_SETIT|nr:hypothetical protein SETIT_4G135600v2 [Setaria italica]
MAWHLVSIKRYRSCARIPKSPTPLHLSSLSTTRALCVRRCPSPEAPDAKPPMAAAPPPWVILRRRLRLVAEEQEAEHPVAIFATLWEPPRATIFDVTPSVHRGPIPADKLPYVVATGPSALLLGFSVSDAPIVTDNLVLARNIDPPGDAPHQPGTSSTEFVPRRIGPSMPVTYNARSVALTFSMFGGYAIAELHVTNKSSDRAKLLLLVSNDARFFDRLFSSDDDDQWTEADLPCPLPTREREWSPCGVVDHDKNLWWFDLSWGLLSCNPTAMPVVLRFHDLPPGCDVGEPNPFIHTTRCISVSDQFLRYVDIAGDADRKVVMWTWMHDPGPDGGDSSSCSSGSSSGSGSGSGSGTGDSSGSGSGSASGSNVGDLTIGWHKTYEMSFKEIWNDASYRHTHLLPMIPEIVLVSPRNPNVVCFFLQTSLFFVDVPAHRVIGVFKDARELLEAPGHRHCFLPWDLPPSIAKGIIPSEGECGSSSTTQRAE